MEFLRTRSLQAIKINSFRDDFRKLEILRQFSVKKPIKNNQDTTGTLIVNSIREDFLLLSK